MFNTLAAAEIVEKTKAALEANAFTVLVCANGAEAKAKALEILPAGAEVMNMTSMTLESIGLAQEIMESGKFLSVRKQLMAMDRKTQSLAMEKMRAAPEWAVGSVHAITHDGNVLIASMSGSQLPGYVAGAAHVLWIVGTHKIVSNIEEGMRRIKEHALPLENERAKKAYGVESAINKILIVNADQPGRTTIILVNEVLGF